MLGTTSWSHTPYRPFFFDPHGLYLCALQPGETDISLGWLGSAHQDYQVMLRPEGRGDFAPAARVQGVSAHIAGLSPDTDYELYIQGPAARSAVRLFRTGRAVGTVVNYLHPRDPYYSFSGQYLCSPSMVRCPDGSLLTSMDLFAPQSPQNLTLIFRSDDDGATWRYVCDLYPCFWGNLMVHRGDVYMIACSTEYGDLLIGRSRDGGDHFDPPVTLLRGACQWNHPGVHKNPQPMVEYRGRLYGSLEWGAWAKGYHAAMVMSADADADLLDPASWHFTLPVRYAPSWPGVAQGPSTGNIEGSLTVGPDGKLYNVMRYDMTKCTPNYGLALAYEVDTSDPDAPLRYAFPVELPGNHSKFTIRRDDVTGTYFSIVSRITGPDAIGHRNLLSLMVSHDLIHWQVAMDLIDRRDRDPALWGFQYVYFLFDGEDLIWLCRTAMNGAHNFHDANYQTFHRLPNFRRFALP